MKNYREATIRKAEIAQLIILQQLYSLTGSRELIFQGGTALRWCYAGSRFSEDLDDDLSRFLPPEIFAVHQAEGFSSFLEALKKLFSELNDLGLSFP